MTGSADRHRAPIAYDDALRARLHVRLGRHERREHPLDGRHHAAVAIVLVDSAAAGEPTGEPAGGAAFLLCRRASGMRSHAGQWALPGGRLDDGEAPLAAALRELQEELGVRLGPDSLVGWLDDYPTRSGYVITPVVLWGGPDPDLRPAPDEVRAVYRIALHALRDCAPRFVSIPESERPVLQLPLAGDLVHAPTAAILFQLRQVGLLDRVNERVDHLEQPVFAWR